MKRKLLLTLFMVFSIIIAETDKEKSTLLKIGDQSPEFSFTTLRGNDYSVDNLKGKIVLINFFATWCSPCNAEIPHLNEDIFNKIKDDDFFMMGIGREHTDEELIKFAKKKEILYPVASDSKREIYSNFADAYIPRNVVLGKDGKIIFQCVGFDKDDFAKMIEVIKEELE